MLDVSLDHIALRMLRDVTLHVEKSTHVAVVGSPGCGTSTLLRIIAGVERPSGGTVRIGSHDVTRLAAARRPLLYATPELDVPERWSVEHALVNAVRSRTLDRVDRRHELLLAADKWQLETGRRVGSLSSGERARLLLARIELRKPAIVIADRLLRDAAAHTDEWYRTLRVLGATVISAPATSAELGRTDAIAVLEQGRIAQSGAAAAVYARPGSIGAAVGTGAVNAIRVIVRDGVVESPLGQWPLSFPVADGEATALVRPEAFSIAAAGEESDLIFGIEEAAFETGRWRARGLLSGGVTLEVFLPAQERIFKGRLLPLRFDPSDVMIVRS